MVNTNVQKMKRVKAFNLICSRFQCQAVTVRVTVVPGWDGARPRFCPVCGETSLKLDLPAGILQPVKEVA